MYIEPVCMASVVNESVELLSQMAESQNVEVLIEELDTSIYVEADRIRFRQIILNLLSNAIKYNRPEGGSVSLSFEVFANKRRLKVVDTGLGIAKDKIDSLFEPFNRLGAEATSVVGTGIGLTITKQLVEMMHGSLYVESEVGEGTKFSIDLPFAEPPIEKEGTILTQTPGERTVLTGSYTLLYVEDNMFNRQLLEVILERREHWKLFTAEGGKEGIKIAVEHKPDIIIMDLNMPGIDGFETLLRLRKLQETKEIPVVALSGNAMPIDIKIAIEAGFDEYLTKPINVDDFYRVVGMVLNKKTRKN